MESYRACKQEFEWEMGGRVGLNVTNVFFSSGIFFDVLIRQNRYSINFHKSSNKCCLEWLVEVVVIGMRITNTFL